MYSEAQCIYITSCRLGAWQFLADLPYASVSLRAIWRMFWCLYSTPKDGSSPALLPGTEGQPATQQRTLSSVEQIVETLKCRAIAKIASLSGGVLCMVLVHVFINVSVHCCLHGRLGMFCITVCSVHVMYVFWCMFGILLCMFGILLCMLCISSVHWVACLVCSEYKAS